MSKKLYNLEDVVSALKWGLAKRWDELYPTYPERFGAEVEGWEAAIALVQRLAMEDE